MVIAESDPLYKGYTTFAEAVGNRTNGGIQATVYPNAQLDKTRTSWSRHSSVRTSHSTRTPDGWGFA